MSEPESPRSAPYREAAITRVAPPALPAAAYRPRRRSVWSTRTAVVAITGILALGLFFHGYPWGGVAASLVALVLVKGGDLVSRRLAKRGNQALNEAMALLQAGDTDAAQRSLDALIARARWMPDVHAAAVMQLALVHGRRGDFERALSLLRAADESGWLATRRTWRLALGGARATMHAATGELDEAEAALRQTLAALKPEERLYVAVPAAVVALRRGRAAEAREALDEALTHAEALPEGQAALLGVLHALALDLTLSPLPKEEVARRVEAREKTKRTTVALERGWPELEAFEQRARADGATER